MAENSQIPTRGYKLLKGQTEQNLGGVLKVGSGLGPNQWLNRWLSVTIASIQSPEYLSQPERHTHTTTNKKNKKQKKNPRKIQKGRRHILFTCKNTATERKNPKEIFD